jgi:hypothetical protein
MTIAMRDNLLALIMGVNMPNIIRSTVVNFGERFLWRDSVINCFLKTIFSAEIALTPPGNNSFSDTNIKFRENKVNFIIINSISKNR